MDDDERVSADTIRAARRRAEMAQLERQKQLLEQVVGMASALPRRDPGPLTILPFRELVSRR